MAVPGICTVRTEEYCSLITVNVNTSLACLYIVRILRVNVDARAQSIGFSVLLNRKCYPLCPAGVACSLNCLYFQSEVGHGDIVMRQVTAGAVVVGIY